MALLMLGPWTPMIFQGQEFGATTPFLYFADHEPEMGKFVDNGRRQFLSQFPSIADEATQQALSDPGREETFAASRLRFGERQENSRFYGLFKDLVRLRRTDEVFSVYGKAGIEGAVLSDAAFVLRFFGDGQDRLLVVNLGADLDFWPAPEPLLAPLRGQEWKVVFSTEDPRYGGAGIAKDLLEGQWRIPAGTTAVLASKPAGAEHGRTDS
jgi:maltooligosyltrehalose trehalohydrolase